MLRTFGIDITGCTFGLSCLSKLANDTEENFIHPSDVKGYVFGNKLATVEEDKLIFRRSGFIDEEEGAVFDSYDTKGMQKVSCKSWYNY